MGRTAAQPPKYLVVCLHLRAQGSAFLGSISASLTTYEANHVQYIILKWCIKGCNMHVGAWVCRHVTLCLQPTLTHGCMRLQVVPQYNSEMAPNRLRGAQTGLFQLFVTIGILVAGLINYGADFIHTWGWRLPLALAGDACINQTALHCSHTLLFGLKGQPCQTHVGQTACLLLRKAVAASS